MPPGGGADRRRVDDADGARSGRRRRTPASPSCRRGCRRSRWRSPRPTATRTRRGGPVGPAVHVAAAQHATRSAGRPSTGTPTTRIAVAVGRRRRRARTTARPDAARARVAPSSQDGDVGGPHRAVARPPSTGTVDDGRSGVSANSRKRSDGRRRPAGRARPSWRRGCRRSGRWSARTPARRRAERRRGTRCTTSRSRSSWATPLNASLAPSALVQRRAGRRSAPLGVVVGRRGASSSTCSSSCRRRRAVVVVVGVVDERRGRRRRSVGVVVVDRRGDRGAVVAARARRGSPPAHDPGATTRPARRHARANVSIISPTSGPSG